MSDPRSVLLAYLFALAFGATAWCARPERAWCPDRHDLRTGIRRDGSFECWPTPVGDPDWDGTFGRPERSVQPGPVLRSRIYCTGGSRPIVIDQRAVGCQR